MGNAFGWPHLLIILAVILLLFGAAKLPALAKSLGQSARVFKGEMKAMKDDDSKDKPRISLTMTCNQARGTLYSLFIFIYFEFFICVGVACVHFFSEGPCLSCRRAPPTDSAHEPARP